MISKPRNSRKSVRLKRQRNGKLRAHWYGQYRDDNKQHEINLNVKWRGTPPSSGKGSDAGDVLFEASRKKAEEVLTAHVEESRHKGRAEHLTERLIELKTGRAVEYVSIVDLPRLWRNLGREAPVTERYLLGCDARFQRFIDCMRTRNPSAVHLYEITPQDTAAFVSKLRECLSPSTAGATVRLLNKAFARFLPVGAANPFASFVGNRSNVEGSTIHRKPFTPEELKNLLDTAKDDAFMFPLITAAACTGMRRGDVCKLKWQDVDLTSGMLAVKTSKTDAALEIPIFKPLREVLNNIKGSRKGNVFPDAARMYEENASGLSWRFKKIAALACEQEAPEEVAPEPDTALKLQEEALNVISKNIPTEEQQERMKDIYRRYAKGESMLKIGEAVGLKKQTVSYHLHRIEDLLGKPFLRAQAPSIRTAMRRNTQAKRENGERAASIRDWHSLRATFVTLALAAGVPVELVRRVTGHATVEIVLKHYFRPDREQFRLALTNAMPGILTGGKEKRMKPAEELAAIAGKIAAGTATESEKIRLKKLATKI